MSAIEEVNAWRRHNGLPEFIEDDKLTEFAQMKSEYRALRGLKNGHQGPEHPNGTTEGTGEATADWGWLTCAMEDSSTHAGAGVCVGWDDERYMVLVVRPPGRRLVRNVKPLDTSYLTPNPVHVRDLRGEWRDAMTETLDNLIAAKRS